MDNIQVIRKVLNLKSYEDIPQYFPLPDLIEIMRFLRSGELEKISGDTRIADTKLCFKTRKILSSVKITRASDLFNMRDEDFLKIRGLGVGTLKEINEFKKTIQTT